MGTLKTTLKVESTDLFPTPVSFMKVVNNAIANGYSSFAQATVDNTTPFIIDTQLSNDCFLYVEAPSTNTDSIVISTGSGAVGQLTQPTSGPGPYPVFTTIGVVPFWITTNGNGVPFQIFVTTDSAGAVAWLAFNPSPFAGSGFQSGDQITISGTAFGLPSPADDITTSVANTSNAEFATIKPGDVGFFPIGSGPLSLLASSGSQVLNYYIGTR